jgi:hypothetical protein
MEKVNFQNCSLHFIFGRRHAESPKPGPQAGPKCPISGMLRWRIGEFFWQEKAGFYGFTPESRTKFRLASLGFARMSVHPDELVRCGL